MSRSRNHPIAKIGHDRLFVIFSGKNASALKGTMLYDGSISEMQHFLHCIALSSIGALAVVNGIRGGHGLEVAGLAALNEIKITSSKEGL
jgi:hypothetical protein